MWHITEGTPGDKNELGELADFFKRKKVSSFIIFKKCIFPFEHEVKDDPPYSKHNSRSHYYRLLEDP